MRRVLFAMWLLTTPAAAQSLPCPPRTADCDAARPVSGWIHAAIVAQVAAQTADLITSLRCHTGCLETAPLLRPIYGHPIAFTAVKIATTTAFTLALVRARRSHPKATLWVSVASAVGFNLAALHNARHHGLAHAP